MNRFFLLLLISGLFNSTVYARCFDTPGTIPGQFASDIVVNLSDKLSGNRTTWTEQRFISIPASILLKCSAPSQLEYRPLLREEDNFTIGFENGKYRIGVKIASIPKGELIAAGDHSAAILNVPITMEFTLRGPGTANQIIMGNDIRIEKSVVVTDATGVGFFYWLERFVAFVFNNFTWPSDNRDLFFQPLRVIYEPKMTTCTLNNAGLIVNLPRAGIAQLTKTAQPGKTPFTLNFSCNNLLPNGNTDRSIDMFLSSNNLLPTDNTVMVDNTPGAAQGVGIRVIKDDVPVRLSTSPVNRGTGTSIFNAAAGTRIGSNLSIHMAAYYFPHNPAQLTSGELRTTATLNIIYQ